MLTGCASIYHSIRCALALADYFDDPQPEWEVAVGRLGHALAEHPESFVSKDRWSMEWYYPVLGGALRGAAARARIDERWNDFVVPGLGIRCVDDRPWVTGAETCELVMALDAIGDSVRAHEQFAAMHHLREARRLLLDRAGVRRRQALAGGAHHLDGCGDDPGRRRAVVDDTGERRSSVATTCRAAWKASSTVPALRAIAKRRTTRPATPDTRSSTRIDPVAATSRKSPVANARR